MKLNHKLIPTLVLSGLVSLVVTCSKPKEVKEEVKPKIVTVITDEKWEVPKGVYTRWQVAKQVRPNYPVSQKLAYCDSLYEWNAKTEFRPGEKIIIGKKLEKKYIKG